MSNATTPYINCGENDIEIVGEPQNLDALADMLKLKAKMGKKMSATMTDGINKPIKVTSSDELLEGESYLNNRGTSMIKLRKEFDDYEQKVEKAKSSKFLGYNLEIYAREDLFYIIQHIVENNKVYA